MKKFAYVACAAFAAFLVMLGFSTTAQAYPDVAVNLTADKTVVNGGDKVTVTADSNVACSWSETWNNENRASAGSRFVATYVAPKVTKITKLLVKATCDYVDPDAAGRATATSWDKDLTITVVPAAAAVTRNAADLPSTGGPGRIWVAGGLVLLLAGASALVVARRRAEAEFTYEPRTEPLSTMGSLL